MLINPTNCTSVRAGLIGYPSALFLQLNDYEIRKGKKIGVTISYNNHRLFVGYIPKNRDRDDLFEEFSKHARKLRYKNCQRSLLPGSHFQRPKFLK